jgi:hypothetical protein
MRAALLWSALSALPALACLSACTPPRTPTVASELGALPANSAQLCVVRPEAAAAHVTMSIRDNGRVVGATRGRTYACWLASPGMHQITSDADDTGPTLVRARAGARYFLHQEVGDLSGAPHAHLDLLDEQAAEDLIESCEARVRVAVPGHDDEPAAQPIVLGR